MKCAHEAPLSVMTTMQEYSDYDYALVHLFEENEEYYQFFVEAIAKGRHVILDNSIFELEEAFDADKFANWIYKLLPTEYIVPDALEDVEKTISQYDNWLSKYDALPGKKIGVAQGKSEEEFIECYRYMVRNADKVGISFDYSFFETEYGLEGNKYQRWSKGRQILLKRMVGKGIIDTMKPHHLLGAGLSQEFAAYSKYDWIDTIDTSNPVVHGIEGIRYELQDDGTFGLQDKCPTKLFTLMDKDISTKQLVDIIYNVTKFRNNIGL